MPKRTALIIGAGPAGLTAAYEFLDRTDFTPIVLEATDIIGGISRTAVYKGNRMDIGGHRFFSKSDRVMDWWLNILPMQGAPAADDRALHRSVQTASQAAVRSLRASDVVKRPAPDPEVEDDVMLVRSRLSRILFLRKFFDYPVSLSGKTVNNLGLARMMRIGTSYLWSRVFPIREVRSLEDFFTNQFGGELYRTFFRDYTQKVWGVACRDIPPEWGAQRVKGLSLSKAIGHAVRSLFVKRGVADQKQVETSLIESFYYPKYGPGQLWERVARLVQGFGGEVYLGQRVVRVLTEGKRVTGVETQAPDGTLKTWHGDVVLSTMPVRDLAQALDADVPADVRRIADGLMYRDFMTVGVLTRRCLLENRTGRPTVNNIVPDNWIYVQEPDVKVGRLQIFNNWSPYLVADPSLVWIGMEYFCNEGDAMWTSSDSDFSRFAVGELAQIGVVRPEDVLDTTVIRVQKAYPAYFGTYAEFEIVRRYLDAFENLFLIGRNGMHRYNNMDHSMLTAMAAVDHAVAEDWNKDALWAVNAEEEYHETK